MTRQPDTSDTGRRQDPRANLRRDLSRYSRRESGDTSFWQSLSVLGSVGWPIVLATAGGALAGRWLHARWNTSIWLTLVLVVAGAVVGMVVMWQLIQPRQR